jgi:hypothetical protein
MSLALQQRTAILTFFKRARTARVRHVRKYTSGYRPLRVQQQQQNDLLFCKLLSISSRDFGNGKKRVHICVLCVASAERCERARGLESLCVCVGAESDFHSDAERENELRGEYSNDGG